MARARALLAAAPDDNAFAILGKIQDLSSLGYVDDAFAVADHYVPGSSTTATTPGFLFLKLTEPMRRDPRFMRLAQRLGLVDYWRASGHWPDFCSEPGLPYSCQAEAAKLSGR
jgi:hypothetical protein